MSCETRADTRPPLATIVLRALLYAVAAATLVLYAPSEVGVFIYWGF